MSFRPPRRRKRLLFQHAQQFGLQHQRNLADFVQEQRAFVGQFEDAALLRARVRESALFVAEQLAFQQRFRNRRAVDGDERLGLPQALVVQRLGDQVLAGAVFAFQQDGSGLAGRYAPHEIQHFAHARRFGDHLALLRRRLLGNVLDGGHHSGELAGVVEHLVGAHHHQALHAVVGMQADRAVGRRRRLVQAHQHAATGLAHASTGRSPGSACPASLRWTCRRVFPPPG